MTDRGGCNAPLSAGTPIPVLYPILIQLFKGIRIRGLRFLPFSLEAPKAPAGERKVSGRRPGKFERSEDATLSKGSISFRMTFQKPGR